MSVTYVPLGDIAVDNLLTQQEPLEPLFSLEQILETIIQQEWDKAKATVLEEDYLERLTPMVEAAIKDGLIAHFATKTTLFTNKGVRPYTRPQSTWFEEAEFLGLRNPAILTLIPPQREETAAAQKVANNRLKSSFDLFMRTTSLEAQTWSASNSHITVWVAERREQGLPFLPQDTSLPREKQAASCLSGTSFAASSASAKFGKRVKVSTMADWKLFTPKPSKMNRKTHKGNIEMPDGSRIRFQAHNSKAQGDGGGMIRESAARQLARLNGQRLPKNLYAIYMVVMGSNYAFKGQFILVPDRHFPKRDPRSKQPISPDISLIIDLECFNEDVWSSKATKGKMLLKKHKPNTRLVYVEPLIQWKVTSRLIDPNELTTVSAEMAKIKLNEEWRQAITKPQDRKFGPDADPATATTQLTRQDRAEKIQAEKNAAYVNYLAANRSIWASTSVIDRVFNRTVGNYQGHIEKSLPLPGIMASGETLNFVHSFYAEPDRRPNRVPKGFIRLISLRGKPSQLVGFAMNEKDQQTYMFANDTMDGDDTANVNFIRHDGQIRVFLKRPQMSIDGGVILRLSPRDQRFALRHYHVYNQIGHHFFPKGLYDIVDGKPNYPDRLKAKQTKVTWSTDPENFLDTLMKITKDRGIMGRICNAAALLDYGDLWQENFKFSMSGEVIDAHLNGTGNAANILEFLHREILKAMQKDQRMDPCVYPRVEKHLKAQNDKDNAKRDAKGLAPLPMPKPNLKCGHGDKLAKDTSAQTIEWLKISVNRAKNLTNGPKAALVTDYNPKIAKLVSFYFKQRNQTWARAQKDAALVREDKDIPYPERLIAIANLEAAAAAKEAKTIRDGYSACIRREGYQPGTFTAYWGQMALSRANRWDNTLNNGTEPKAVSVHVLDANLPNQERIAFQHLGKAVPTLIIPTDQRYLLSPKGKCTIQKSPKGKYTLTTPSGRKHLATLGATARHYAGLELQVVGYIPDHSENLRQAENLLVLQIKDPENLSF